MKVFDFKGKINKDELNEIMFQITSNNLVIFPTETVYGLGANALSKEAVDKIFIAKGRPNDNPLIVHVSNINMINDLVESISDVEQRLIDNFMPGPFTLILPKKDIVPYCVTGGLETVAIRMPNNKIAHDIIEKCNCPIAAPSANISTKPSGTNVNDIMDEFDGNVSIIVDGGETNIGVESTVVKVIDGIPTILRPGKITKEDIEKVIGTCEVSKNINENLTSKVESPGMKYKHYAPNKKCLLVYSKIIDDQIELVNENLTSKTLVICFREDVNKIKTENYLIHGSRNNYEEISHNIFSLLRKVDKMDCDFVIIEGVSKDGLGLAIMNRLIKSCSHNYIEK